MATKTTEVLYDDIDGSTDDVATYQFAFNGVAYEIDLSIGNFDRMAAAFTPFLTAGRRLPRQPTATPRPRGTSHDRIRTPQIRSWWTAHWQERNLPAPRPRGAIPQVVRDAYHAAH